ncbi:hypothetical protein GZH46_00462, partial [Fragariocoptes setiger]
MSDDSIVKTSDNNLVRQLSVHCSRSLVLLLRPPEPASALVQCSIHTRNNNTQMGVRQRKLISTTSRLGVIAAVLLVVVVVAPCFWTRVTGNRVSRVIEDSTPGGEPYHLSESWSPAQHLATHQTRTRTRTKTSNNQHSSSADLNIKEQSLSNIKQDRQVHTTNCGHEQRMHTKNKLTNLLSLAWSDPTQGVASAQFNSNHTNTNHNTSTDDTENSAGMTQPNHANLEGESDRILNNGKLALLTDVRLQSEVAPEPKLVDDFGEEESAGSLMPESVAGNATATLDDDFLAIFDKMISFSNVSSHIISAHNRSNNTYSIRNGSNATGSVKTPPTRGQQATQMTHYGMQASMRQWLAGVRRALGKLVAPSFGKGNSFNLARPKRETRRHVLPPPTLASISTNVMPEAPSDDACWPSAAAQQELHDRCTHMERQVGSAIEHNLPSSEAQLELICKHTRQLTDTCWTLAPATAIMGSPAARPSTSATPVVSSSNAPHTSSRCATLPGRGTARATSYAHFRSSLAPVLRERIAWIVKNLCLDDPFRHDYLVNVECLSRWSKLQQHSTCAQEYERISKMVTTTSSGSSSSSSPPTTVGTNNNNVQSSTMRQQQTVLSQNDNRNGQVLSGQVNKRQVASAQVDDLPPEVSLKQHARDKATSNVTTSIAHNNAISTADGDAELRTLCCQAAHDCGQSASEFVVRFFSKLAGEDVKLYCTQQFNLLLKTNPLKVPLVTQPSTALTNTMSNNSTITATATVGLFNERVWNTSVPSGAFCDEWRQAHHLSDYSNIGHMKHNNHLVANGAHNVQTPVVLSSLSSRRSTAATTTAATMHLLIVIASAAAATAWSATLVHPNFIA